MNCPNCNTEIRPENLNVQTDIGKCTNCGNVFRISESIDADAKFNINEAPEGAWHRQEMDTTIIGASTKHWIAFFLVPFMLVWSGFSLGGIYGTQIVTGEFSLFTSLFGIPFILGSVIFWSFTLMAIFGKVELTVDRQGGRIFTGVGTIGITRKFNWSEISRISENAAYYFRYPGNRGVQIVMEGKRRLAFGSGLSEARRYYLLHALKKLHSQVRR